MDLFECETLKNVCQSDENKYGCMKWIKIQVKNSKSSQLELYEVCFTFGEIVEELEIHLNQARRHFVTFSWSDHAL